MRRGLFIALAILAALPACGDDGGDDAGGDTTTTVASSGGITIRGFAFAGATVTRGATVNVRNNDAAPHTVSADTGEFDTRVDANSSGTFKAPDKAGAYAYSCKIHPNMKGTLTVS